jgi:two-component system, chemotaxis family, CheB/CheR fusion protein
MAEQASRTFFVVGIGASAGGLEALSELLKHVPADGMAFVVVQHLAPDHESMLTQLLARTSKLEVVTAEDGMALQPERVYVIPPNTELAVMQNVLRFIARAGGGAGSRLPIDFFLRSLADDRGPSAIGVILSGTGTDGTFGLKAIKAAGGITFVQELASAKYDGMPRSALESGCADFCLTPQEIGRELTRISEQPKPASLPRLRTPTPHVKEQLAKLFVLVRAEFGTDLTHYKPATVERRIERRMTLHKIERVEDYVRYVQSHREELAALYEDMLITVTSFFRDHDPMEALKSKVFSQLLEHKEAHAPLRVWVPACATGEEAYSLAICLLEFLQERAQDTRIQIFATDLDEDSIQHARRGVYPRNIELDVSPERLHRFFVRKNDDYQVCRRIRDAVVFSRQNLLKDAPFSRIDLVSCRNLLIYLQPPAQKQVLRILHYALNPFGFLLLGTSETVGDAPDLFSLLDRKNKIYAKKPGAAIAAFEGGFGGSAMPAVNRPAAVTRPSVGLQGLADRKVLELYGPPGVIVNERLQILHFRGHTGPYLDPAPGAASFDILRIARPELHIELKRSLQRALSEARAVSAELKLYDDGKPSVVKLEVLPIEEPEGKGRCLLVLFHKLASAMQAPSVSLPQASGDAALAPFVLRIEELERELIVTKDFLQSTVEEKESANQELKSANEELQSANEELQSTNEELETSKEEMQSTNEELTTVNDELQNRMSELREANDDLHNVLSGVDNAIIIVGLDLRIRRYTAAAEKLFNLVPADLGRAVKFLDAFVGSRDLGGIVTRVASTLSTAEEEILASNQRWYALRVSPYKTLDHSIRGAVVALADIDVRKRAADLTRNVSEYAGKFLDAISHPLLIVDAKMRVVWANEPFYAAFKLASDETIGNSLFNVGARHWVEPALRELLEGTIATGRPFRAFRIRRRFQEIGERSIKVGGSRIPVAAGSVLVLVSIEEESEPPKEAARA